MDLFSYMGEEVSKTHAPLASRLRPRTLDEIVGQKHILDRDKLLYRAIQADKIRSIIFFGPPGTGKTTIAKVIAGTTSALFKQINATIAGKKDMEAVVEEAKQVRGMYQKKTILFIDEIHRFNKSQQDYLLPFVEDGTLTLIGATTENPFFEVNSALISRSQVFELKPLSKEDIKELLHRAITDKECGFGNYQIQIEKDALDFLAHMADGDARCALNGLELAVLTTPLNTSGIIDITLEVASECIQRKSINYDKDGNNHYDTISAFIKSIRGSDPDAALYYLAKMLYAGEDIKFIARRIVICASEDVGNADPYGIVIATNAFMAIERIGMPEARIILAQAVTYLATAPKSNAAYLAIDKALDFIKNEKNYEVPRHIRNANYQGEKDLNIGIGYKYAHNYPNHYVHQQYLPDEMKGMVFYHPTDIGYEKKIDKYMEFIKQSATQDGE